MSLARWRYVVPLRLRSIFRREPVEQELDEELRFHLDQRIAENVAAGMAPDEAARAARVGFGNQPLIRERSQDAWGWRWLDELRQDGRAALRALARAPVVSGAIIISLALGVGANTAIFSVFHEVLLRQLSVPTPHELLNLSAPGPKGGHTSTGAGGNAESVFSYPLFRDLERLQTPFAGIAAHRQFAAHLSSGGRALSADGLLVSGQYFPTLDVQPTVGRLLQPADDRAPGANPVVVLSYAYWQDAFDTRREIVGDVLRVNGQPLTIVGVAPRGFEGTTLGHEPHVFVPLSMKAVMEPAWEGFENRLDHFLYVFARLTPGMSMEAASAAINVPFASIIGDVELPLQDALDEADRRRFKARRIQVEPGGHGQTTLGEWLSRPVWLLLGVTGTVLLIACANIANLLLARASHRAHEMAVRLSIGAGRRRLVRQLLVESCLLALLGGLAGIAVAGWALGVIGALLPAEVATLRLELNSAVWVFAAVLSAGTGLLVGVFPALHSTRPDTAAVLKGQVKTDSRPQSGARGQTSLVTAQIALSVALVALAGLFAKSLANIDRVDLGMQVNGLVTFRLSPLLNGYTADTAQRLFEQVEERLSVVPGVEGVTVSTVRLLSSNISGANVSVEGFDHPSPRTEPSPAYSRIGPNFFQTLGIPLLAGREFVRRDDRDRPRVAIVNQAFARTFALGRDVVGKRMEVGRSDTLGIEIVGLVQDAKYSEVKAATPPQFFLPAGQGDEDQSLSFYVRSVGPTAELLSVIREVVSRLDATLPIEDLGPMQAQVSSNVALDRLIMTLAAAFAVLATVLAAVGLYGVLAYTVSQRTQEIGLRMALGADAERVRRSVLRHVAAMAFVGCLVGVALAFGLGRLSASLLFELESHDPTVLAGAVASLLLVALGAGAIPARRAARIAPMRALRSE